MFFSIYCIYFYFFSIFFLQILFSRKSLSQLIASIFIFSQYFFSIDLARWKREPLVSERKSLSTKLLALNPATCTDYPASYAPLLPCIVYILLTLQRVSIVKPFCVLLPQCLVLTPHLDNFPKNPKNDEIMFI